MPHEFRDLDETIVEGIRYCNECERKVFLCGSDADVERHKKEGHCVAVPQIIDGDSTVALIGTIGEVKLPISDSDINAHRRFVAQIDRSLSSPLREIGFCGPRTSLVRETESFVEHINIVATAGSGKCHVSHMAVFPEIHELGLNFQIASFWKEFDYADLSGTLLQDWVAALREDLQTAQCELNRIRSTLDNFDGADLQRPLSAIETFEKSLSDHHLAWFFQARGHKDLAENLAKRGLRKLAAFCARLLNMLEKGVISEREFFCLVRDHRLLYEDLGGLVSGYDGRRILSREEVFAGLPPAAHDFLKDAADKGW